jgi:hypothetical protein
MRNLFWLVTVNCSANLIKEKTCMDEQSSKSLEVRDTSPIQRSSMAFGFKEAPRCNVLKVPAYEAETAIGTHL